MIARARVIGHDRRMSHEPTVCKTACLSLHAGVSRTPRRCLHLRSKMPRKQSYCLLFAGAHSECARPTPISVYESDLATLWSEIFAVLDPFAAVSYHRTWPQAAHDPNAFMKHTNRFEA